MTRQHAFYCRDCDIVFDSAPDEMGHEQAPCPKCRQICMTVAFEREEQDRHRKEAWFFSFLGRLTGLFHIRAKDPPRERDRNEALTIVSYSNRNDAEHDVAALAREGIHATLKVNWPTSTSNWSGMDNAPAVELQVLASDVLRATKILHETVTSEPQVNKPTDPVEDVTFDCEECGTRISFPGHRRGRVETCPHCQKYVDVPE